MGKELIEMINSSQISVEKFYLMHPFSSSSNITYSNLLTDIDFFSEFYVISNITYERLSEIAALSNDKTKNTMIITGYRGCGKTNFLRYCQAIIDEEVKLREFSTVRNEIKSFYRDCGIFALDKLEKKFKESIRNIKYKYLNGIFANYKSEDIENHIHDFINQQLIGNSIYINFGGDKSEDSKPLEIKLMRLIEEYIEDNIGGNLLENIFNVYKETERDIKNTFENASGRLLIKNFFDFLQRKIGKSELIYVYNCKEYKQIEDQLDKVLSKMEIDQLLFIAVLLRILIQNGTDRKIFFLLDNIDIISKNENLLFYNTIMKFWDFLREMRSYIDRLRRNKKRMDLVNLYDKCNFIFAMRETTAMHICDDLRERVKGFSDHFDISKDVEISMIIDKKSKYFNMIISQGKIYNEEFKLIVQNMQRLSKDQFFFKNLYPLFNNDYRTAIRCLLTICLENNNVIAEAIKLIDSNNDYMKYGGRGIIYRLIFEKFEKGGYLESLGIFVKAGSHVYKKTDISYIRVCLTVLAFLQKNYSDRFFVNQEESVELITLYEFYSAIAKKDDRIEEVFVKIITSLFSLRNKSYWNHLLTFDNILSFSEKEMVSALKGTLEQKTPILVRTTMAGEKYLQIVCVHFEFFACRFCSSHKIPLFTEKSYEYISNKKKYRFEIIIGEVFNAVQECCKKLKEYNDKILDFYNVKSYNDILDKPFTYDGKFHEERIIHSHISYLESYRWYLINNVFTKDAVTFNKKIIFWIKRYLELLIYKRDTEYDRKFFYSNLSKDLYEDFYNKIESIIDKGYNDKTIRIIIEDKL